MKNHSFVIAIKITTYEYQRQGQDTSASLIQDKRLLSMISNLAMAIPATDRLINRGLGRFLQRSQSKIPTLPTTSPQSRSGSRERRVPTRSSRSLVKLFVLIRGRISVIYLVRW